MSPYKTGIWKRLEELDALIVRAVILIDHMGRFVRHTSSQTRTAYIVEGRYLCALLDSKIYLRSLLWILNRICMEIKNWKLHYDETTSTLCACLFLFLCKLISGLSPSRGLVTSHSHSGSRIWLWIREFRVYCCAARRKVIRLRKWIPVVASCAHFCTSHYATH